MKNSIFQITSVIAMIVTTIRADRMFYHVHAGLNKRQINECGYGNTCVEACGQGFITCWGDGYCFNPSAGETCCAEGGGVSCQSGSYCVTTASGGVGCCPVADTLGQCHASISIAPVATDATLASYAPSASRSRAVSSSSPPSSSSGAQVTKAAMFWDAEAIGLGAAGLGLAMRFF